MNKVADARIAKRKKERELARSRWRRHRARMLALFWPITRNMSLGRTSRYWLHALLFVALPSLYFWAIEMASFFTALELLKYDFFMDWNSRYVRLWLLLASIGFLIFILPATKRGIGKPDIRRIGYVGIVTLTPILGTYFTTDYIDYVGQVLGKVVDTGIVDSFGMGTLSAGAWLRSALLNYAFLFFLYLAIYILLVPLWSRLFFWCPYLLYAIICVPLISILSIFMAAVLGGAGPVMGIVLDGTGPVREIFEPLLEKPHVFAFSLMRGGSPSMELAPALVFVAVVFRFGHARKPDVRKPGILGRVLKKYGGKS